MFPPGHPQVVSWNVEPLGSRDTADSVQREFLPGEEQPDRQKRLLTVTQVDIHSYNQTEAAGTSLLSHTFAF